MTIHRINWLQLWTRRSQRVSFWLTPALPIRIDCLQIFALRTWRLKLVLRSFLFIFRWSSCRFCTLFWLRTTPQSPYNLGLKLGKLSRVRIDRNPVFSLTKFRLTVVLQSFLFVCSWPTFPFLQAVLATNDASKSVKPRFEACKAFPGAYRSESCL